MVVSYKYYDYKITLNNYYDYLIITIINTNTYITYEKTVTVQDLKYIKSIDKLVLFIIKSIKLEPNYSISINDTNIIITYKNEIFELSELIPFN